VEYPELENYKGDAGHVIINSKEVGGRFECEHCGTDYTPAMPCPMNLYLDLMNGFLRDHKGCEVRTDNRLGLARLPKALREEEDAEDERTCETCDGERTVEGSRVCGNTRAGGCADGMCGGCYQSLPCPECGEDIEQDWDSIAEDRAESRALRDAESDDEVDSESPI
jgi:hypothetical protein